jgi:hypothetical protein
MTQFVYDEDNFQQTAEVVVLINEYLRGCTTKYVVGRMIEIGHEHFIYEGRTGYVSTLGFVLSHYTTHDGKIGVKASISSGTMHAYINREL